MSTTTLTVGDVVRHHYDIKRGFTTLGLVQEINGQDVKVIWASKKAQAIPSEYSWYKIWDLMKVS